MNPVRFNRRVPAFSLVELLVVMAIIGTMAALLLPVLNRGKARSQIVWCQNNLQEIGIAFHSFAHDHNSRFPMEVSVNDGGSMEFVQSGYLAGEIFYFSYHHFQPLAEDLVMPEILICPADTRLPAANFGALQNSNISYFVGVTADFSVPESILAGDRNLATNWDQTPSILTLGNGGRLRWTQELHQFKGNILFADGHVEEWNQAQLASAAGGPTAALFLPSSEVPPTVSTAGSGEGNSGPAPSSGSGNTANINRSPPPPASPTQSPSPAQPAVSANWRTVIKPGGETVSRSSVMSSQSANPPAPVNVASAPAASVPAASESSEPDDMSPVNRKILGWLRYLIGWSYLFLLAIFLIFLLYKLWQLANSDDKRRINRRR